MDYPRFVRTRRPIWEEFESRLEAARRTAKTISHRELETLAFQYRQVLHDHALAASRYADTGAARRLRALALEGTHWLQWDRSDRLGGPVTFFTRTFPEVFRRHLPHVAVTFGLFAASALLGLSLTIVQPGLGTALLGPEAVQGLKEGRLWTESLTTTIPPAVSSSAIATNNMAVALTGWAGGLLAGFGSLYVALLNGFILGAIVGATMPFSLAGELLEFVAAHGPLEITLILVTAGGGLALGRAVVAADDRPRSEALREAGRGALILLVGCLPWFAVLGVVEGVISPDPDIPAGAKVALGAALESIFLILALNPFRSEVRSLGRG